VLLDRLRARACFGLLLAAVVLGVPSACVGPRSTCDRQSDCTNSLCSANGYCQSECRGDSDCPCGSHCVTACGACIRNDGAGAATCFPFQNGVGRDAVLGACGLGPPAASRANDGGNDNGICATAPLTLPECVEDPSGLLDATLPNVGDAPRPPPGESTDASPKDASPSDGEPVPSKEGGQ
jgi:hypothetical protein